MVSTLLRRSTKFQHMCVETSCFKCYLHFSKFQIWFKGNKRDGTMSSQSPEASNFLTPVVSMESSSNTTPVINVQPYHHPNHTTQHLNHSNNKKKMQEFIQTDRGKIMIFVDGSNLFYTAQMMGIEIDYIKLVNVLVNKDKLIRANFYSGIDNDNMTSVGWKYFMKRTGFRMVTKQVVSYSDGKAKADCDVEMAVDMINFSSAFDTCILITGDGDLTYAVDTLVQQGKQVEVVGHKQNTKDTLIHSADRFIDLESIKHLIIKGMK